MDHLARAQDVPVACPVGAENPGEKRLVTVVSTDALNYENVRQPTFCLEPPKQKVRSAWPSAAVPSVFRQGAESGKPTITDEHQADCQRSVETARSPASCQSQHRAAVPRLTPSSFIRTSPRHQGLGAELGANRHRFQATSAHNQILSSQLIGSLSDIGRHLATVRR